ncbi:VanZ family protein [Clostridium tepidum]|jgi:glycopeptide antibiotics resistance protein|uniref:Permease n=1 Tax=Clostridium tepidum TaxID=1962263 RepID=A0A1S9I0L8_9CLOT|nr:VanZ family protein [Clostridium tepidum]MCR1933352.1 VanZ family protein [Clostridium tepidum]MDU6878251.1 VanZ family protein [Clostridium botulinum]OOO61453.1 permease [Clostridium tepidum]OOO63871.1 permease [Clostridium tepidum]
MEAYTFPIKVAILTVPILIYMAFIPYCIFQYREHGFISKYRSFIHVAFIFYIISSFYLVILPLPPQDFVPKFIIKPQLKPFNFIGDFIKEYRSLVNGGYKPIFAVIKNRGFWQVTFNIILLTPLGFFLKYAYNKNFKKTFIIVFCTSLFFEVTQLTGIFGIYKYAYRLFDVDDLILNTFGGVIGYYLVPIVSKILPDVSKIDSKYKDKLKVSYTRRAIAFFIDSFIINMLFSFLNDKIYSILFLLYIVLSIYITNGYTIGKKLVKIKVINESKDRLKIIQILKRYLWLIILTVFNYLSKLNFQGYYLVFVVLIYFIVIFVIGIMIIKGLFNKEKKLFYERFSQTYEINSFKY